MSTDSITVDGGAGGVRVSLDELVLLGNVVRVARDCLDQQVMQAQLAVQAIQAAINLAPGVQSKATLYQALASAEAVTRGRDQLRQDLSDLVTALKLAAANYAAAEESAQVRLSTWANFRAGVISAMSKVGGPLGRLSALSSLVGSLAFRAATNGGDLADLLRLHHQDVRALLDPTLTPGIASTETVAGGLASMAGVFGGDRQDVTVTRGASRSRAVPSSLEALIRQVDQADPPGNTDPSLTITKVTSPAGAVSWIVAIPGTTSLDLGFGDDPHDMATNLRAVAGQSNALATATAQAMDQAGIKPGQPVLLTGHSQGGIVAAGLASSSKFLSKYNVRGVMTAGSPIATLPVSSTVKVLAFEHVQDVIPVLDGKANVDARNVTTVTRDLSQADEPHLRKNANDTAVAHGTEAYESTARMAQRSGHASVRDWMESVEPMMSPGSTAQETAYIVRRP